MGYIVMAYAPDGYQEYILPEVDNADHQILLDGQQFGLQQDLAAALEIVDGIWSFVVRKDYSLRDFSGASGFGRPLSNGLVLYLSQDGRDIMLVTLVAGDSFPVFQKYNLDGVNQIPVGKENSNLVCYSFENYISANHALLFRHNGRWVIQDSSSNGSYLNGRRLRGQAVLKFGDQVTLFGLRLVFLGNILAICALSGNCSVDEGKLPRFYPKRGLTLPEWQPREIQKEYFKRAPRTVEELYTEKIEIEAPPLLSKTKKRPLLLTIGPSLTMAVPMMLGCMMSVLSARSRGGGGVYMFTGIITAVSSAVIGVIWALLNLKYAGKEEEAAEELRYNTYGQYLIDITEFIKQKYDYNRTVMLKTYPSGSECCSYGADDVRLWNHNERQPDFLMVRLGTGSVPFQAEIAIPKEKFAMARDDLSAKPALIKESYRYLTQVPVCVDIRKKGLFGIVGGFGKDGAYAAARTIAAQIAANNCYTDVKMVFIYERNAKTSEIWSFARWLPHVWMEDHKTRLIAGNKSELGDICYEMSRMLQARMEESDNRSKEYPLPHFVIFVDSMEMLSGELLERFIYNPQPEYGITTILLAKEYKDLPNSCENIIQNDEKGAGFFHIYESSEQSRDLVFDPVSLEELEQLSRRLCGIEVKEVMGSGEIPNALDFFDMYGIGGLDGLHVLERWKKNRNYENMRVPIGQKAGGNICYLDIHEKYHGPHGLVAGTTGSGKSETLQTYILSLAVNFSPDDVAFFIIDFKGGGMANLFDGLPHMAGQISNLSGNQVQRAMISIKSENMRRQRVFAEHGVNNINLYTRLYKNHEASLPVPHLFIIIDEFAELKREEPEFMKELISVAQVGRSLGVHLILATQKPGGTVDDNIWSNSKFRLCLRVQDRQDSNDMLHKPDAAYITQAGRGYLQVGSDEIYEQFQSGFSGAEYIEEEGRQRTAAAVMMTITGKEAMIGGSSGKKKSGNVKAKTQLDAVIEYLDLLAKEHHYEQNSLLWLPVLPTEMYLDDLEGFSASIYADGVWPVHTGKWMLRTQIGLYDDPANQSQKPLVISFDEGGHLAVCGTVSTGKSTFLQSMLYGLMQKYSPAELNCYILDYSSRMLLPFEKSPHCGGVIVDTDEDKVNKFFYMLDGIMNERKILFGGGNYSQYMQAHKNTAQVPAVLVVIDNYSNFREKTANRFDDNLLRLSREGVGYGIFLAVSSAGFGSGEIPQRAADNIRTVLSLEMGDKFKYAEILHTTRVTILPEQDVKGRGLAWAGGNILEFQTAMAVRGEDAYEISGKIEQTLIKMDAVWKGKHAKNIPVIPEHPLFSDFIRHEGYPDVMRQKRYLPFGYRSLDAGIYAVDLRAVYCFLVQGRERSGKKNVLKILLYAALQKQDAQVYLIDFEEQLKNTAEQLSVTCYSDMKDVFEFLRSTVPIFKERNQKKQELLAQGAETEEIAEKMEEEPPVFIFITDLASFVKNVYQPPEGVGNIHSYLENITAKGLLHRIYFIAAMNLEHTFSISGYRVYQNMASYRTGVHLGGNINGQKLFSFGNIPYQEQGKVTKPGLGLTPSAEDSGTADKIVIPFVKGGFTVFTEEKKGRKQDDTGGNLRSGSEPAV